MIIMNTHRDDTSDVENHPHQHAFTIVGKDKIFGIHMTQYHCEIHKYQIILKLSLPDDAYREFRRLRQEYPSDFFVLCNQKDEEDSKERKEFSIPELASGRRKTFIGDIFQGIRWPEEDPGPHFFPWSRDRCNPAIEAITVDVDRIVLFRPFAHHLRLPDFATYWLFGQDNEAHMTNLQTAALATGPFEVQSFGPDYDHVMSLDGAPTWLEKTMLEAGVVVTTPKVRMVDRESGEPTIPCCPPFPAGESIEVLYRGIGQKRTVIAGQTFLHCTLVCNSEEMIPCDDKVRCHISNMPKKYWC